MGHIPRTIAICCVCLLVAGVYSQDADNPENTFFRPQSDIATTDTSTEENIPGLAPTDVRAVKKAVPNLEPLAPGLTILSPLLPDFYKLFNAIGWYMPTSWPLAGTGPTGDWLHMVINAFKNAFLGVGPRPPLAPVLLVAAPEAYKKFPGQVQQYGQFQLSAQQLGLGKLGVAAAAGAVADQITRNMMLPEAPLMMSAPNGTVIKTMGGVTLTLIIKDDGRYLVSNTTTSKLLHSDIRFGPHTICIVDSFVVPKLFASKPRPTPLMTEEDKRRLPEILEAYRKAFEEFPQAISETPGAIKKMIRDQLPDQLLKIIDSVPQPLKVTVKFVEELPQKSP